MKLKTKYRPRSVRFIEIFQYHDWRIKIYSISMHTDKVAMDKVQLAKLNMETWLAKSEWIDLANYKIATLILHECKEGCFAIVNWWVDENMLQHFVYLLNDKNEFELYSQNGIVTCVWEMAILWHERNAWVKHVMMNPESPDFKAYLNEQLNQEI